MNRWKIAFFISLFLLINASIFFAYCILDQGVTLTYQKEGYKQTESDLETLIKIINTSSQSKQEIEKILIQEKVLTTKLGADTIALARIMLIFKDEKLVHISKQW